MACEDWPCCGHEQGCCPDFDPETGAQLNMKCTCGATVPLGSRSSICETCLNQSEDGEPFDDREPEPDVDELTEHQDFAHDDEWQREDFGDFGYEGLHEA